MDNSKEEDQRAHEVERIHLVLMNQSVKDALSRIILTLQVGGELCDRHLAR